ncbi:MarR family transcriptional regulator [Micrococcus sp. 2A]|uniref:MarR family winged helix-turn-helix transcriptional regulator n=1 Tax=Micrococcus sp. 2A TaxID=3142261 RepID=UPI00262C1B25|nr:MarR family transcriptional regulator [uncultured Micrococcus sp.]
MAEPHAPADQGPEGFEDAVQELEGAFTHLVRQHRRILARQAEALSPGMSPGAMKAFAAICHTGPLTPSALAEHMLLDRAQVSRLTRELEAEGLVRREPDPQDRRSALLSATDEGRARLDEVRGGPAGGGIRQDLRRWDLEEIHTLTSLLLRFVDERETR